MYPVRKREMGDTTLSYAVGNKGAEFSLAGLPSPHREHLLNKGPATPSAGSPSLSSLRDATSPKGRGLGSPPSVPVYTYALLPQRSRRRYAWTFRLCQGLSLWESWTPLGGLRGRGCWQEAVLLVWLCLSEAQPYRKHDLNLGPATPPPSLPSPSSLCDATSPKVRGLGSPQSLQFGTLRPAAARGAVRRCAQTSRLCQGLSLWESWREAPERASPAEAAQGVGLDSATDGADSAPV